MSLFDSIRIDPKKEPRQSSTPKPIYEPPLVDPRTGKMVKITFRPGATTPGLPMDFPRTARKPKVR
jgi:hypothetical protein